MSYQSKLKPGDPAPEFSAQTTTGEIISLSQFKGRNVVLYFYPKDNTPGCTKQACAFRDAHDEFQKLNAIVLGVSTDSQKSHQKFTNKFRLPFPLLVDENRTIVNAYGVWGEKSFLGRRYMGTHRVTFLIGPDRRIRQIWSDVKAPEHSDAVLAELKK